MHKQILKYILITILIGITNLQAQNAKLDFGYLGGPSMTNLVSNSYPKDYYEPRLAFSTGFQVQWNIINHLSLASGIFYESKGINGKNFVTNINNTVTVDKEEKYKLNYLVVPVLCRGMFGRNVRFYIEGGPYIGMLLSGSYRFTDNLYKFDTILDIKKEYKPLDLGITAGWGVEFPILSRLGASITLRNNIGLSNVYSPQETTSTPVEKERTYSTNLLIGVHYKITNDKEYKVKDNTSKTVKKKPTKKKKKKHRPKRRR